MSGFVNSRHFYLQPNNGTINVRPWPRTFWCAEFLEETQGGDLTIKSDTYRTYVRLGRRLELGFIVSIIKIHAIAIPNGPCNPLVTPPLRGVVGADGALGVDTRRRSAKIAEVESFDVIECPFPSLLA